MFAITVQFFFRLLISFSKFGFAIFLSKEAPLEVLGQYGLIAGFSLMLAQLAGLELHYVNVRRLLGSDESPWPLIANQLKFNACTHIVIALLTVGLCVMLDLPGALIPLVVVLVFADHMSQEAYRFLVALHRPGLATLILTLKSAGWMLIYIFLVYIGFLKIGIISILAYWSTSSLLGLIVLLMLATRNASWRLWIRRIDLAEIVTTARQAWPFLVMAFAYATAQSLDRMLIHSTQGAAQTGVYFFFLSLASGAYTLISYPAALLFYPHAIQAYLKGNEISFRLHKRRILISYMVFGCLAVASIPLLLPWALERIGKLEYIDQIPLFWALLAAQAFLLLADFALIDIYVRKLDRTSMLVTLAALTIYITSLAWLPSGTALVNVAYCLCGFYGILSALRLAIRFQATRSKSTHVNSPAE